MSLSHVVGLIIVGAIIGIAVAPLLIVGYGAATGRRQA
jgi:hypothetical protein